MTSSTSMTMPKFKVSLDLEASGEEESLETTDSRDERGCSQEGTPQGPLRPSHLTETAALSTSPPSMPAPCPSIHGGPLCTGTAAPCCEMIIFCFLPVDGLMFSSSPDEKEWENIMAFIPPACCRNCLFYESPLSFLGGIPWCFGLRDPAFPNLFSRKSRPGVVWKAGGEQGMSESTAGS